MSIHGPSGEPAILLSVIPAQAGIHFDLRLEFRVAINPVWEVSGLTSKSRGTANDI
jgi:hypothetical protein